MTSSAVQDVNASSSKDNISTQVMNPAANGPSSSSGAGSAHASSPRATPPAAKRVKMEHQSATSDLSAMPAQLPNMAHSRTNGNNGTYPINTSTPAGITMSMGPSTHQAVDRMPLPHSNAFLPSNQAERDAAASLAAVAASTAGAASAQSNGLVELARPAPPAPSMSQAGPSNTAAPEARGNDVDQLQDLLGMSGVDLRAEEEAIHGRTTSTSQLQDGSAFPSSARGPQAAHLNGAQQPSPFYLELYPLSHRIHKIAARNGLEVEPDVLMHISRATQMRFRNLLTSMVNASRHRQWSSQLRPPPMSRSGQPMYHEEIHDDPQKILNALSRVEKTEEQAARQLRIQREEMEARQADGQDESGGGAALSGQNADGTIDSPTAGGSATGASAAGGGAQNDAATDDAKRKGKKLGAAAAARNMTEDKRLKLANNTAARALGISSGSKAWMFGGGNVPGGSGGSDSPLSKSGASRLPKPRFAPPATGTAGADSDGDRLGDGSSKSARTQEEEDGTVTVGGWGDLAARQRRKQEEERERKRRVNLDDAMHALEMERKGGAGLGSGERVLFATRALGRPTVPLVSNPLP